MRFSGPLLWGDVSDSGVDRPTIVIGFDGREQVARHRGRGIRADGRVRFQGAEDALDRRIVPAVWLAAHRWGGGGGLQDVAIIAGSVLTAAIRVMDHARPRTAPLDGHGQWGNREFGAHMLAPRPTNYLAGEPVEAHGQVEPALDSRDIGDIRQPDLGLRRGGL